MRAIGVGAWVDRGMGRDVAVLEVAALEVAVSKSGAPRLVGARMDVGVSGPRDVDANRATADRDARTGATGWRARWPDLAAATRAGTWGDGGRDY